jgi:uncharacterized small protein (DUF1192 family)
VRSLLVIALCLTGCSTSLDPLPKQPDAPTDTAIVQAVGKDWDKIDQKVAASVAIARENAEKPEVVRSETSVALSFLPAPSPEELALARQRAAKADQKDYADAVAYGKKLLAKIDADWAKVEAANAEALRVSQLKDARIAELLKEIERVKADAAAQTWTWIGGALAVAGALCTAFLGPRLGLPLIGCGMLCGAVPFIIESEYFAIIVGTTLAASAVLLLWVLWDKARDQVNAKPYEPPKE